MRRREEMKTESELMRTRMYGDGENSREDAKRTPGVKV